ncbi:MAG: EAL domain-containing protein, partial [Candidatus Contendobacter sp.]
QPLERLPNRRIVAAILDSVARHQHVFGNDYTVLYLKAAPHQEAAILFDSGQALAVLDRPLFEVFVAHIAACFRNVNLVESLRRAQREIERQRSFLRAVIDADPHCIYVKNQHGRIMLANQCLARSFGLTPEQMVGRTPANLMADPEWARVLFDDDLAILTQTRDRIEREVKFVDPEGQTRWIYTLKAPIKNEAGEVEQVIGVNTDITERKQAEEALFEAKERAQITLHSIGDAVITTDARGVVDYLNPVAEALTGWTTAEARGRSLREVFRIVNEQTRQPAPDPVGQCLQEGQIVGLANHSVLVHRDGLEYDIDDSAAPIRGRDGQVLGAVLVFHDVTETRRLTRQLAHDATHDALTGLINRPEFERRLERALTSARLYGARHALCYLDLDQFKVVNDTAGHAAGDELLKQINTILSGMFRERDTLARIGGDEFGLLLDNCPLDRAQVIAQTVVSNIRDYRFHWEGRGYQIGVSIGLVPITAETRDTTQLLTQADVACYIAKETGRNRVHLYQQEDSETTLRHSEILGAAGLRDALEQDRFRLHYQPIVPLNAPDQRPVRYEALLRVACQDGLGETSELVLPAAFIPAAERYGLMGAIDRWVIETAFREYAAGVGQTGARIAINLSGNSLGDESLLGFIEARCAAYAFSPEWVCFEITETTAIQNLRRTVELMAALKQRGSQLALDDFGSGLSSFRYLKTLPVDYLKIDGGFVKDMMENANDSALVAAINQMSHTLGIQTIAEYVHSQAIAERLRELGVDYAQGYFFGRPAPWGEASCE